MFASFLAIVCRSENWVSVSSSIPTKLADSAVSTLKHLCFNLETLSADGQIVKRYFTFFSKLNQPFPFVYFIEVGVFVAELR